MHTITIHYFESAQDKNDSPVLLGQEHFNDIEEAAVPNTATFTERLYLVKKFAGRDARRWLVIASSVVSQAGVHPVEYHVVLKEVTPRHPEEWLGETLKKFGTKASTLLRRGTFVEVDYGFHPAVVKSSGDVRSNKRYPDFVQAGGMPKRRLAIVIKTHGNSVQVVPISSKNPKDNRSCFELDRSSLADMVTYTKQCWAIAHMVESVSIHRILPPETHKQTPKGPRYGRNTKYAAELATTDLQKLNEALLLGVGQGAYVVHQQALAARNAELVSVKRELKDYKRRAASLADEVRQVQQVVADQASKICEMEGRLARLDATEQLARQYVDTLGGDFDKELAEQMATTN